MKKDFALYAPEPFSLSSPVCRQMEQISTENLLDLILRNESLVIQYGGVLYGSDMENLESTQAFFIRFKKPYTNSLVLKCVDVPDIEGMYTGTSDRKRMHRPLAGNALIGNWHAGDNEVIKKLHTLKEHRGIDFGTTNTYLNLWLSIFTFLKQSDDLGESFIGNTLAYSEALRHQWHDKFEGSIASSTPK
jgi:hypothetical protein